MEKKKIIEEGHKQIQWPWLHYSTENLCVATSVSILQAQNKLVILKLVSKVTSYRLSSNTGCLAIF